MIKLTHMKVNLHAKQRGISLPVLICNSAGLCYVAMNKLQVNFCLMTNQSTSTPSLYSQYTARKVLADNHDEKLRIHIAIITIKAYFQYRLVVVLKWMCSKMFSRWPFQFATEKYCIFAMASSTFPSTSVQPKCTSIKLATNIHLFFRRKNTLYLSLSHNLHNPCACL